jgi:hydroxyethylthiazole kinase-like uncharacterized protein yjeF
MGTRYTVVMHPLYTVADIRAIERDAAALLAPGTLMGRAGTAAARLARSLLAPPARRVLVLAGPGNNGGDAVLCAAELATAGLDVTVVFTGDAARLPPDAARAHAAARPAGLRWLAPDAPDLRAEWDLVVDGLFGIGLARPVDGAAADLIACVNALSCPVLALDVPSGLDADTGQPVGAGPVLRATHTLTFIGDKPGLHTGAGRDYAGAVAVDTLGLAQQASTLRLGGPADFAACLAPRRADSHKGSYGDVAIVGGAPGMGGAVILAARAAAYCGAGRVFAGFVGPAPAYDPPHPELMCRAADTLDFARAVAVAGPGMSTGAQSILARVLAGAERGGARRRRAEHAGE